MTRKLHLYRQLESTNVIAREHFNESEHGDGWLADAQTAGRGRRELTGGHRIWFSPPGTSIYLSVIVQKRFKMEIAPLLTLACGAYVTNRLFKYLPKDNNLWLKWPNDIFVKNKKLGGILTEGMFDSRGFAGAVVGVGLNVNTPPDIPEELKEIMATLEEVNGSKLDRLSIALDIQEGILEAASDLEEYGTYHVMKVVHKYDKSHGRTVFIKHKGAEVSATSQGINDDGTLKVEIDETKETLNLSAGEVNLIPNLSSKD